MTDCAANDIDLCDPGQRADHVFRRQGIAAGEFEELVRAIKAGVTYVNVHSSLYPPGEIRGQIKVGD